MPPVIAAVAAIFTAVGVSAAVATWIATLVVNGVIMFAAQKLLGKKPDLSSMMGDVTERQQMVRQAVAPRRLIYGKAKVSGPMAYARETGSSREYLHLVVLLATHECDSITKYYLNDEELTLDGSGNVTSPAQYVGYCRVKAHLGTSGQAADTDLVSESGGEWSANCKLSGICYLYIRVKFDQEKFPTGLPNFSAVVKGKKVLDPRTATTAWSENPTLCIYDYMRDAQYGLGAPTGDFDSTFLNAAANVCDESVALLAGGSESRYTLNGTVDTDMRPGDVLEAMLSSMVGTITFAGGKWFVRAGAYDTPTITLDENDLRGPIQVTTKLSRRELANRVKGTYVSELDGWQPVDFPAQINSTYLSEDGGEQLWSDLQLPFSLSGSTAQRIGKIQLERGRQQIAVRMPCKLTALKVQAGMNIMVTNTRFGWTSKVFEVTNFLLVRFDQNGVPALGVDLVLRETASAVWDWNSGMETDTDPAPNTTLPNPFTIADPTSLSLTSNGSTTSLQPDGTVIPRILVGWVAPADQYVQAGGRIRIQYKTAAAPSYTEWTQPLGATTFDYIDAVIIGVSYNVRIRSENVYGKVGNWVSGTITVAGDTTAPAVPTGLAAVAGTGKAVSLDWDDNTDDDFSEYKVFRNTVNNSATATEIAEVRASRFVDVDVTIGTAYFYWLKAVDRSENVSGFSSGASATPGLVGSGSVDSTPPSDPSAPTLNTSGTYLSGDGTVLSRLVINIPAMPAGAVVMNLLYRRNGAAGWIVADQRSTGGSTSSIDDLTPGQVYDVGLQAFTSFGYGSNIVTLASQTAPNKSAAPNAPTSITYIAGNNSSFARPASYQSGVMNFAVRINWTEPADLDVSYYEWVATSDSDAAADIATKFVTEIPEAIFSANTLPPVYFRVRAIDRTGNASAWAGGGTSLGTVMGLPAGTMSNQNSSAIAVTGGTLSGITALATTGITTGSGSSQRQVKVRQPVLQTISLTGGAVSESYNLSLTNWGFSTAPDSGWFQAADYSSVEIRYDWDDSSSSTAVLRIRMLDGTNLPTSLIITGELVDYT